ncbi:MAG: hypothetical protein V7703_11625 [Hyphomicrobiales bacterium]
MQKFAGFLVPASNTGCLLFLVLDAGYGTKSNFYTQFSKRTGITPPAYRAGLKQDTRDA